MNRIKISHLLLLLCLSTGCTANETATKSANRSGQGVKDMIGQRVGRFALDIPASMQQKGRSHRIRLTEVDEIYWPKASDHNRPRDEMWSAKVAEIRGMRRPERKRDTVIEERVLPDLGQWAKGIFYYSNWASENQGVWEVVVDYGSSAIVLKADSIKNDSENSEKMLRNLKNIAHSYRNMDDNALVPSKRNWFFLQHGALDLAYRWEEKSYARFEGHPLNLIFKLEMTETHTDEPEDEGLLGRVAASILTGYAAGVDIDRIRSRKRKVAGLEGEEEVDRMSSEGETELSFVWRYAGKKDSGEHPEIVLDMESPDGKLDEKLKVWDAILDSMKPVYSTQTK